MHDKYFYPYLIMSFHLHIFYILWQRNAWPFVHIYKQYKQITLVINEWLFYNANAIVFHPYDSENKLNFVEVMMKMSPTPITLSFFYISDITQTLHWHILSSLWTNQYLILLHNTACLWNKHQINTKFIVFSLFLQGLEPTICRTRCVHANHYPTNWSHGD